MALDPGEIHYPAMRRQLCEKRPIAHAEQCMFRNLNEAEGECLSFEGVGPCVAGAKAILKRQAM